MPTQAYNLLWLSPPRQSKRVVSSVPFDTPIPPKTVETMLRNAQSNPTAEVRLWVDSQLHTEVQMSWLRQMTASCKNGNFSLHDLRSIDEYNRPSLSSRSDTTGTWRTIKHSLIWQQVDAAKLLVCLQGDYDQVFYSDADTTIDINSEEIQRSLSEYGLAVGGSFDKLNNFRGIENQAFGFNRTRIGFFANLYYETIRYIDIMRRNENGFKTYVDELLKLMHGDTRAIAVHTEHDGTSVLPPDEEIKPHGPGWIS